MNENMTRRLESLSGLNLPGSRVVSVSCEESGRFEKFTGLPPFCRVSFESSFGPGSFVRTEVWLPYAWNGIFTGLGNGGMAGSFRFNTLADRIRAGYAAANTDMGTSGGRNRGVDNPDVWKDFGWRATHAMTELGKAAVLAFYGKSPEYSYFIGSSTGGQQALGEAQRFPEDYDGIIAGAPGNNRVLLHIYFLWNHRHLTSRGGEVLFPEGTETVISDLAAEFFQRLGDGVPGDSFVTLPWRGAGVIDRFIEYLRARTEFSDRQLEALRAVYTGPTDPVTGKRLYCGMPIGAEGNGGGIRDFRQKESPNFYPFIWVFGPDYCGYDFDFHRDVETVRAKLSPELDANSADLDAFRGRGGKLLIYSGSADPWVPYPDALNYLRRLETRYGRGEAADFCRYFLSPGRDHGGSVSGRGATALWSDPVRKLSELDVLRAWREHGETPEFLTAARVENGEVKFARRIPMCGPEMFPDGTPPVCDGGFIGE